MGNRVREPLNHQTDDAGFGVQVGGDSLFSGHESGVIDGRNSVEYGAGREQFEVQIAARWPVGPRASRAARSRILTARHQQQDYREGGGLPPQASQLSEQGRSHGRASLSAPRVGSDVPQPELAYRAPGRAMS